MFKDQAAEAVKSMISEFKILFDNVGKWRIQWVANELNGSVPMMKENTVIHSFGEWLCKKSIIHEINDCIHLSLINMLRD